MILRKPAILIRLSLSALILVIACLACAPQQASTIAATASQTASITFSPSSTPAPSKTPTQKPTVGSTSPPPAHFENELLRAGNSPQSYIEDECGYLALRWDPEKALPGSVVAPIMYHSIRPGNEEPGEPSAINADLFYQTIELAQSYGFETITSQELINFLYNNEPIPQLSMILVLDDRRPGTAEEYFLPVNQQNDWTTTLAWPIGDTDSRTGLWEEIESIVASGYFDVQAHGLDHNVYLPGLTREEAQAEISGPIPILSEHFGNEPIIYVWPGGLFSEQGVELAREAGYQAGFTVYSRGPILFNAIPQGAEEAALGDPLMTLPRFWSSAALLNLEQAYLASQNALEFAIENYPAEAAWYAQNCGDELPPLEQILASSLQD